jgi:hypothetical protein
VIITLVRKDLEGVVMADFRVLLHHFPGEAAVTKYHRGRPVPFA